jgi:hypothetical protein
LLGIAQRNVSARRLLRAKSKNVQSAGRNFDELHRKSGFEVLGIAHTPALIRALGKDRLALKIGHGKAAVSRSLVSMATFQSSFACGMGSAVLDAVSNTFEGIKDFIAPTSSGELIWQPVSIRIIATHSVGVVIALWRPIRRLPIANGKSSNLGKSGLIF